MRTFKRRAGRVTTTQARALERLWPAYGLRLDGRPLDPAAVFGRTAPLVVEVGFGMGDATAALAAEQPEYDVLAVDVHTPGHGNLLKLIETHGLTNVRVLEGDGRVLLGEMLSAASVSEVRVFFPDPWPKARHAKRRLVTAVFADLVADRLVDGGLLHVATDVPAYAAQVAAVVDAHPLLVPAERVPWRPVTKFEARAIRLGHPIRDLVAQRLPR